MRSFVLSTYTLKPYGIHPSNFKSRGFFVFSFFCFFLFPFESYDIALQSSGTQQREREREKQKNITTFFSLFFVLRRANIYLMRGMNSSLLFPLLKKMQ